jgi:hypothetical protein
VTLSDDGKRATLALDEPSEDRHGGVTVEHNYQAEFVGMTVVSGATGGSDASAVARAESRRVVVELAEPLAGRPIVDGSCEMLCPVGRRGESWWAPVHRVDVGPDGETLVVYFIGGLVEQVALNRVEVVESEGEVRIGVLLTAVGDSSKLVGIAHAALARLEQPLGSRRLRLCG